jgi:hypothetical protein
MFLIVAFEQRVTACAARRDRRLYRGGGTDTINASCETQIQ